MAYIPVLEAGFYESESRRPYFADVVQLLVYLICNERVEYSIHFAGFHVCVPKWL